MQGRQAGQGRLDVQDVQNQAPHTCAGGGGKDCREGREMCGQSIRMQAGTGIGVKLAMRSNRET